MLYHTGHTILFGITVFTRATELTACLGQFAHSADQVS